MNTTTTEIAPDQQAQACKKITKLRAEIDICDAQIVDRLAYRLDCVKTIGEIKRSMNMTVHDPSRESSQLSRLVHLALDNNIPPEQVVVPFLTIIQMSRKAQNGAKVENKSPIMPKLCIVHGWRTCGIEIPESAVRVCPTCLMPLL